MLLEVVALETLSEPYLTVEVSTVEFFRDMVDAVFVTVLLSCLSLASFECKRLVYRTVWLAVWALSAVAALSDLSCLLIDDY